MMTNRCNQNNKIKYRSMRWTSIVIWHQVKLSSQVRNWFQVVCIQLRRWLDSPLWKTSSMNMSRSINNMDSVWQTFLFLEIDLRPDSQKYDFSRRFKVPFIGYSRNTLLNNNWNNIILYNRFHVICQLSNSKLEMSITRNRSFSVPWLASRAWETWFMKSRRCSTSKTVLTFGSSTTASRSSNSHTVWIVCFGTSPLTLQKSSKIMKFNTRFSIRCSCRRMAKFTWPR